MLVFIVDLGPPLSITMTKFTVTSTTTQTAPSKMTVKKVHQKCYWKYDSTYLFDSLIEFACLTNGTSIRAFLKRKENLAKSSFLRYFKQSGLADLKSNGPFNCDVGKVMLTKYFEQTLKNCANRTAEAYGSCCYLADHEEHVVVQLCTVLGSMGYGVTRKGLHRLADNIVNKNVDDRECMPILKHVTEGLLKCHKNLVKIVAAASLDPKQARQAMVETRNAMFSKLTSYIEILHATDQLPWWSYLEIPASSIYNMDELGNDTTKHRNKILQKRTNTGTEQANATRTFMRTSEGDGRMPWHITVCLTTRADGKVDC